MTGKGKLVVARPKAARLLGLSLRTFARLEADGVVQAHTIGKGGRPSTYDLEALVPAYVRHVQEERDEPPRDRRDRTQAELNELRIQRERRLLLPRDDVVRQGQTFVKAVVAKLRAIPARLVRTGTIPANAQGALADLVREALDEFSRWSNELDLLRVIEDEEGACTDPRQSATGRARSRRRRS